MLTRMPAANTVLLAATVWCLLFVFWRSPCRYVKGSSSKPIRPHQPSGVLGFSQKCTDYGTKEDLANLMVMSAKPGDIVCHDSKMLHMAGNNSTKHRQRRAVYAA